MKCCKECDKEITKRRNVFCSRNCAGSFNNRLVPKRKAHPDTFCECGNKKDKRAKFCHNCRIALIRSKQFQQSLGSFLIKGNARVKFSRVRKHARQTLERSSKEKKCEICGYSNFVDACHIKGLAEFKETALIEEVNALTNLVFLCPNHHKELDNGLLSVR